MNPLARIARAPAAAVGAGITATIRAQAASKADADSPEAWVHFCSTAADEAYASVLDSPPLSEADSIGSAHKLLAEVEWDRENGWAGTGEGARLWADLPDEERDRAERNGWTAEGWNRSQRQPPGEHPGYPPEIYGAPQPLEGAELRDAARQAAAVAFRACMPKLTGRRATQAYIACVAVAVQRGYVSGSESKALLYTAQLALSAHPSRRASRGRK